MVAMARPPAPRVRPARPRIAGPGGAPATSADDTGELTRSERADAWSRGDDLESEWSDQGEWADESEWPDQGEWADGDGEQADPTSTQELATVGGTGEYGRSVVRPAVRARRDLGAVAREIGRAVRAGLEASVLSWLVLVVPVVAAYIATVAAPVLGEASWFDAARNATSGWLLSFGQPLVVTTPATAIAPASSTVVTLVPIGLTLVTAALLAGAVRRAMIANPVSLLATVLAAGGVVAGGYRLAGVTPTLGAVLTTALVLVGGAVAGWLRSTPVTAREGWPTWCLAGLRAGRRVLLALLGTAAATLVLALVVRASAVLAVQQSFGADVVSTLLLLATQLLALATLVVWALSWLVGPGFSIGAVVVTSDAATAGPLPALPVLAAVPDTGPGPGRWILVLAVLVAAGALVAPLARARDWRVRGVVGAVAATTAGLAAAVLGGLSGGSVGPLAVVGTTAALGLAVAAVVAVAVAGVGAVLMVAERRGVEVAAIIDTALAAVPRPRLPRLRRRRSR